MTAATRSPSRYSARPSPLPVLPAGSRHRCRRPCAGVTICTAFVLTIASGAALFLFVSHAGHRLRPAGIVDLVGDQLRQELEERYPGLVAEPAGSAAKVA